MDIEQLAGTKLGNYEIEPSPVGKRWDLCTRLIRFLPDHPRDRTILQSILDTTSKNTKAEQCFVRESYGKERKE